MTDKPKDLKSSADISIATKLPALVFLSGGLYSTALIHHLLQKQDVALLEIEYQQMPAAKSAESIAKSLIVKYLNDACNAEGSIYKGKIKETLSQCVYIKDQSVSAFG